MTNEEYAQLEEELGMTPGSRVVHGSGPGGKWFGEKFPKTWYQWAGMQASAPADGPELLIIDPTLGTVRIQLWRQRLFYLPVTSDLQSCPFVEILWHPDRGITRSIKGLEHLPFRRLVEEGKVLLRFARDLGVYTTKGAPFDDGVTQRLKAAPAELLSQGKKVTKQAISNHLRYADVSTVQRNIKARKKKGHLIG